MIRQRRRRPTYVSPDATTSQILRFVVVALLVTLALAYIATAMLASTVEWMTR